MTLTKLFIYIGIAAVIAMILTIYFKKSKNWGVTFLQHFCGILFVVSGFVKAVDPLGTAFKMDQYFSAFYYTFNETAFSFIAPIFPFLNSYVNGFSIATIVLEIILGLMLILGARPKLTSWAFFITMLFFTALTGFTYLTGYVPQEANFFEFGKWTEFVSSNMRVSDCGCFGDFLKIEPRSSFFKDVFLMIPAIIFLFTYRSFHRLLNSGARLGLIIVSTAAILVYCLNNTYWNEPSIDFRPFKEGVNVREQKARENEADASRPVTQIITPIGGGESLTLTMDEYMKRFKEFPKEEFTIDQITGEPTMELTKISDFRITNSEDNDVSDQILEESGYSIMIVNYKVPLERVMAQIESVDTIFAAPDSLAVTENSDSLQKEIVNITRTTEEVSVTKYADSWIETYRNKIVPLADKAKSQDVKIFAILAGVDNNDLKTASKLFDDKLQMYQADDILLKTIIRSNPGIVLWKDGTILKKWHIKKAPSWSDIESYMK